MSRGTAHGVADARAASYVVRASSYADRAGGRWAGRCLTTAVRWAVDCRGVLRSTASRRFAVAPDCVGHASDTTPEAFRMERPPLARPRMAGAPRGVRLWTGAARSHSVEAGLAWLLGSG